MISSLTLPPLTEFTALVEATDPDAPFRLAFLRQAAPVLYASEAGVIGENREVIADKLERWRYQLLNKHSPSLPLHQQLTDVLDMAACRARGRPRPPKNPRSALEAVGGITPAEARAVAALDSGCPLDEIADAARRQTEESGEFRVAIGRSPLHSPLATHNSPLDTHHAPLSRRRMLLYAPLYLSSFCVNHCLYCSFRFPHSLERKHLSAEEASARLPFCGSGGFGTCCWWPGTSRA